MQNKPYLIVGIPTYCEAKTIVAIVKEIDNALIKYINDFNILIINADNNSPDNTKQVFLNISTQAQKKYVCSKSIGKGRNIRNILKIASNLNTKALLLFDGDIKNFSSSWVDLYLKAILEGADFVFPLYARAKHDGSITNHVCRPLIANFFNVDIEQPIGGDFALSHKYIQSIIKEKLSGNTLLYGIDIFLSFHALVGKFKIKQVYLGEKIHNPSLYKLKEMYVEVVDSLFKLLKQNKALIKIKQNKTKSNKNNSLFLQTDEITKKATRDYLVDQACSLYSDNKKYINKLFPNDFTNKIEKIFESKIEITLSKDDWQKIIFHLYQNYSLEHVRQNKKLIIASICLFYARHASFIKKSP